jgi:hypothetical protein
VTRVAPLAPACGHDAPFVPHPTEYAVCAQCGHAPDRFDLDPGEELVWIDGILHVSMPD